MASCKEMLDFFLEKLSNLSEVTYRPMMGEYLLYNRGVLIGGIYDDRLLVKPLPEARRLLPDAPLEMPYPGAKPLLLVETTDEKTLRELFSVLYEALAKEKGKK